MRFFPCVIYRSSRSTEIAYHPRVSTSLCQFHGAVLGANFAPEWNYVSKRFVLLSTLEHAPQSRHGLIISNGHLNYDHAVESRMQKRPAASINVLIWPAYRAKPLPVQSGVICMLIARCGESIRRQAWAMTRRAMKKIVQYTLLRWREEKIRGFGVFLEDYRRKL